MCLLKCHNLPIFSIAFSPPDRYLFRGNMPLINGSFVYKNITDVMRKILVSAGHSLPSNFTLVDIR